MLDTALERKKPFGSPHVYAYNTEVFGIETQTPAIKALDWLEKHRGEKHILKSARSLLGRGVLSRRERYGTFGGKFLSGYWREPQNVIHVHAPRTGSSLVSDDPSENWKDFFESPSIKKGGYTHRAYALINAEIIEREKYKGRYEVIPDSVPREKREVLGLFIRAELLQRETLGALKTIARNANIPLIDIGTMERL